MTSLWLDTAGPLPTGAPPAPGQPYDTLVAGAGLTGLTTALLLARQGQRVGLLEARSVGAVTTGNTTAKLSLLQGTVLARIRQRHGDEVLRAYVEANADAQAWLLGFLAEHEVAHQVRTAFTYATTDAGERSLAAELDAAQAVGLPVEWSADPGLPFAVDRAITLAGQAQFHPIEVLIALAEAYFKLGGQLHTGVRLLGVRVADHCHVETSAGELTADRVVLATGVPVLDRGAHFARVRPQRSYAMAFRVPGPIPHGMYLSADAPTRSLRTASGRTGELLLVGGNGHVVGRGGSERDRLVDLEAWTRQYFPGAAVTHAWSAQDYQPASLVPLVGALPHSRGRVLVATGFNKWGMTNAVAAARMLVANLDGDQLPWAGTLMGPHLVASDVLDAIALNLQTGWTATSGWFRAGVAGSPSLPDEGEGVVGVLGPRPAARSKVDGRTCTVSAVCTHLGGIVKWNDVERSWECPLHGSRFSPDGQVLEGPATRPLRPLE